jgi:FkbM family methyltransferase
VLLFSNLPERISAQSSIGRVLRAPLRLIPRSMVVSVRSGLNRGLKWIVGSSTHGCWLGTYETQKQSVIRRFVKTGMKVFDVGANAGFYTLAFARLVGDSGEVWAFEPFAAKADYLLKHRSLNGLGNVHVVQAAVADKPGLAGLRVTGDGSMGVLDEGAAYHVPTVSLDGLIASGALPEPDLIKMDVEGAESLVLDGARTLLGRNKTILFIALHGENQKQRCLDLLSLLAYRVFLLDGTELGDAALPFDEIYALPPGLAMPVRS